MHGNPTTSRVSFHFDVMCPYAFRTSLWMREVRDATGLTVDWRCFSLEEVNRAEGKKHPWERPWSYGWSLLRIAAHLRRRDPELVDRWYLAAGSALHLHGRKAHDPAVARQLLAEIGAAPHDLDAAIADPTTHDDVRADHERVLALGGWGVPTLVFDDDHGTDALFGPVITDVPTGADAVALWELVLGWRRFPHLFELQRPKTAAHLDHIASEFRPYVEARDWQTVQNPTP